MCEVNNVYIFPGMSFGLVHCGARRVPEQLFLAAAEAVAESLTAEELQLDMVVPRRERIQEVSLEVATQVAFEAQCLGLAREVLGSDVKEVREELEKRRWRP